MTRSGSRVPNALPTEPIAGFYVVESDGTINFGPSYRPVHVIDLSIADAKAAMKAIAAQ